MGTLSKSLQNIFQKNIFKKYIFQNKNIFPLSKSGRIYNDWIQNKTGRQLWEMSYMYQNHRSKISLFRSENFHWRNNEHFRNPTFKLLAISLGGLTIFAPKQLISEEDHDDEDHEKMEVESRYVL